MKQCTYCGKEYSDEAALCAIDQQPLGPVEPPMPSGVRPNTGPVRMPKKRIGIALLASAAAIAWTLLLYSLFGAASYLGAMAGARGPSAGKQLMKIYIWLLPMLAFLFIILGSLNLTKGKLRRIGFLYAWVVLVPYALVILWFVFIIAGGAGLMIG